jgi:nucleotide-binding universal stress UspA family protein
MYGRVLVGTDGSPTAAKAVARAVELARVTGSGLTILSVGPQAAALATARGAAEPHASSGVAIEVSAAQGDPAEALIVAADDIGAGLLVVGNRGMRGAGRLLGSVPNKVTQHAQCNVLIVHTA